ncbi:DNA polymerase/3'-5' exonuclease PolX [Allorhodopirellula solitaria]|uniref:DNA polymerase beta n=1 Tax=Allorhodopirellula solitaria TaxID=2527987 RepID=A0A5C5YGH3_9BACT|nr:DNA polymerase/3'-5' exonuclease PolX [Allorhodopirellula solitaria]TWT74013.1 DNA polymerase/3'-5' exonuclease PolX [Allorhodopirellula solitaria]
MDNSAIAAVFEELAELLEFRGENPFRIRAYQNGARAVRDLDEPISQIAADPDRDLASLSGIGKTLAEKIDTLLATGSLPQLAELQQAVPEVVIAMARIPGLGAKKASKLHEALELNSLDDLAAACHAGEVAALKGFGKKTEAMILDGLAIAKAASERIYWASADKIVTELSAHMQGCNEISQLKWAGSYRRGRETVGDLDLLAVATDRAAAMDHFEAFPGRVSTIARGDTKISIRLGKAFQVDLRLVDAEEFGAALQYFTGSQAHNIHVRRIAKEQGLKINEYGVFRLDDDTRVAGATEEEVYAAIGLPVFAPELREDRHEFEWAEQHQLPDLIEIDQIRGDLHMHTSATDGQNTIREMADAAIERGLQYIAITDHSQRVNVAGGLTGEKLLEQWKIIQEIRPEYEGRLSILCGIECDILESGEMDLPDTVLSQADWVLASVHFGQKQSRDQITDRILGAIENPHIDCIAHPTGRLINRREAYQVDLDAVMQAADQHGTFLELNANPARLDLNDTHLAAAKRMGIPIVINTDAHSIEGLGVMPFGILQARRGGLTASDVANTLDLAGFEKRRNR